MPRRIKRPQRSDSGDAFIRESDQRTGTKDDLAEHLAEEFERSIATGEVDDNPVDDELQPEEVGGPFIESAADREFGATRNLKTADPETTPNPVPQAVGPLAVASAEEEQEAVEQDVEDGGDVDLPEPDAERPSQVVRDRDALPR